jgi:hypothetical protein
MWSQPFRRSGALVSGTGKASSGGATTAIVSVAMYHLLSTWRAR